MAEISEKIVEHVAKLARLDLKKEEIKKFTRQLKDVLSAFEKIDEVDTAKVKPSFHPIEIKNVWREDFVRKWKWDALSNTVHKEKKYFRGPKIV
jgi:aspartyl-tRNA(Asn)/glutamyl-tRNA(Gln) amidotransferase subunit C